MLNSTWTSTDLNPWDRTNIRQENKSKRMPSNVKNTELHALCKKFVRKIIEDLDPKIVPHQKSGSIGFIMFISKLEEVYKNYSEYKDCIKCMKSDKIINVHLDAMVGTSQSRIRLEAHRILYHMLEKQIKRYDQTKKFDNESFDKSYESIEEFFYNDKIPIAFKIPIKDFQANSTIDFGNNISIRPITQDEKDFFQSVENFGMLGYGEYNFTHVMEQIFFVDKIIGEPSETQKTQFGNFEMLQKLINALRLFKKGKFQYVISETTLAFDFPPMGRTYSERPIRLSRFPSSPYTLSDEEIPELQKFWKFFISSRYHLSKPIDLAIRRFNFAYDRTNEEDQIIDYLISYESLFFKNEKQELREKISRRVAKLLEDNFEKRKILAHEIKDIYDKRSSIVHGDEASITSDFTIRVEEILRISIKEFLKRVETQNHDDVIDHLDFN